MRAYLGWDGRDALAYDVNVASMLRHASAPVEIVPLRDWDLRRDGLYYRAYYTDRRGQRYDERDGKEFSTDFSFSRFLVPLIEGYGDEWVLFGDADLMWRADVAELFALADDRYAVMCVKQRHDPVERLKMGGLLQAKYPRKNWSSLMLLKPSRCRRLTKYAVNNQDGSYLHNMFWVEDGEIGSLPAGWNWLEGYSPEETEPKVVHYTRGTPDMLDDSLAYADEWWAYARPSIARHHRYR